MDEQWELIEFVETEDGEHLVSIKVKDEFGWVANIKFDGVVDLYDETGQFHSRIHDLDDMIVRLQSLKIVGETKFDHF